MFKTSQWSSIPLGVFVLGSVVGAFACRQYLRRRSVKYGYRGIECARRAHNIDPANRILLVTDLDHTLVGPNSDYDAPLEAFNKHWLETQVPKGSYLCYNTGRSLQSYFRLTRKLGARFLRPDVLITGDGTAIYWFKDGQHEPQYDHGFEQKLRGSYDQPQVARAFAQIDGSTSPLPGDAKPWEDAYRHSVVVETAELAEQLTEILRRDLSPEKYRLEYCSGRDHLNGRFWLACSPKCAGKGEALEYVRRHLRVSRGRTMCAGDSGNDIPMFALQDRAASDKQSPASSHKNLPEVMRGVMVCNFASELRQYHLDNPNPFRLLSRHIGAAAILEGLHTFGF